jgi:hypothetical protein
MDEVQAGRPKTYEEVVADKDWFAAYNRRLRRENRDLRQWQESTRDYLNQILSDPGVQAALDALTRRLNAAATNPPSLGSASETTPHPSTTPITPASNPKDAA